jgi:predicted nuclease with TOPRIM domain
MSSKPLSLETVSSPARSKFSSDITELGIPIHKSITPGDIQPIYSALYDENNYLKLELSNALKEMTNVSDKNMTLSVHSKMIETEKDELTKKLAEVTETRDQMARMREINEVLSDRCKMIEADNARLAQKLTEVGKTGQEIITVREQNTALSIYCKMIETEKGRLTKELTEVSKTRDELIDLGKWNETLSEHCRIVEGDNSRLTKKLADVMTKLATAQSELICNEHRFSANLDTREDGKEQASRPERSPPHSDPNVLLLNPPPRVLSRPGEPGHPPGFEGPVVSIAYVAMKVPRTEVSLREWLATVEAYGGVVGPTPGDKLINAFCYMVDDPRGIRWFWDFCPGLKAMGDRRITGFPFSWEELNEAFLREFVAVV